MNFRWTIIQLIAVHMALTPALAEPSPQTQEYSAIPVSVYQLIATPERYDGKKVYVVGFMHLEFEGDVIYAHREDWVHGLIPNGIALDVPKEKYSSWTKINNTYVGVEAFFSASERGHLSMRAGSLTNVQRLLKSRALKR